MNWREEYPPLIDVDESLKDYVKGELKRLLFIFV